jgi:hypothetical protein
MDGVLCYIDPQFLGGVLWVVDMRFARTPHGARDALDACAYTKKRYERIAGPLGLRVEYVYVLSDWFRAPGYKDTLDYVLCMNCHYHFGTIPLAWLGLPTGR